MGKLLAVFVFFPVYGHCAQANLFAPGIQHAAIAQKLYLYLI